MGEGGEASRSADGGKTGSMLRGGGLSGGGVSGWGGLIKKGKEPNPENIDQVQYTT